MALFNGTDGDDVLLGTNAADSLSGLAGNDSLSGEAGDDTLDGGPGDDVIDGGSGNDTVDFSGELKDYLVSHAAASGIFSIADKVAGRDGVDQVQSLESLRFAGRTYSAAELISTLESDTKPPTATGFSPADGSSGVPLASDVVVRFSEVITRGTGLITLRNDAGTVIETFDAALSTRLRFHAGSLMIDLSADLAAGARYKIEFAAGSVRDLSGNSYAGSGNYDFRTVRADDPRGGGGHTQSGDDRDDDLTGSTADDSIYGADGADRLAGAGGSDDLYGEDGDDRLLGDDGDDRLYGDAGNDTLDGGVGADRMEGGPGADLYYVDNTGDLVFEADNLAVGGASPRPDLDLGQTIDKVISSVDYSLTSFVENLELAAGQGSLAGTGNGLDNYLVGNESNNHFSGVGGNDTIDGQAGLDTVLFAGPRTRYATIALATSFTVTDSSGGDGSDTVRNVERLAFSDRKVALDMGLTQAGGGAALLIGAVLGQSALAAKLPLVGSVIALLDQGFTSQILSGAVMRLDIWGALAGGTSNTSIASYLLTTVNGAAPDATTLASAVAALTNDPQGDFLWHLAESSANQVQVGLVGLAATGLEFEG